MEIPSVKKQKQNYEENEWLMINSVSENVCESIFHKIIIILVIKT